MSSKKEVSTRKKKDTWKIFGLVQRIEELIYDGTFKNKGIDHLYEVIKEEFAEYLKKPEYNLDKRNFQRKILELVWTFKVLAEIKTAVRHRLEMDKVYSAVSYIPYELFVRKWNQLHGNTAGRKGLSSTGFVRGILRLGEEISEMSGEPLRFETGTFTKPFEIQSNNNGNSAVTFLNGVNLGVPYSSVMAENPARQPLEIASYYKHSAVILTNILDIDTKKAAGPIKVLRALLSGRNVNPDDLDRDYAEKAKRIIEKQPHNEIMFQTTAELFTESMRGWSKIVGTKKNPTFNGQILIVLGYRDEEIIAAGAYWEELYFMRRIQNELNVQKRLLEIQIAHATAQKDYSLAGRLRKDLESVSNELARTAASNIASQEHKRYYYKVMRFVIKKIEETIPNSKVIGIGSTFARNNGQMIEINIPRNDDPSDELLADYCNSYGPKVLRERMADDVVICHPFAVNYRSTERQVDADGKRGSAQVFVAPIAVDKRFIRGVLRDTIRKVHKLSNAMLSEQFESGVLTLKMVDGKFQPVVWSTESLQEFSKKIKESKARGITVPKPKYIWVEEITDTHIGSPSREIISMPNGKIVGITEASFKMMERDGLFKNDAMPVHSVTMNDDGVHGHHYENHKQPDPRAMNYTQIQNKLMEMSDRAMDESNPDKLRLYFEKARRFMLTQLWYRGIHWAQDQIEEAIDSLVLEGVDFFDAVLRRAKKSGLVVKGVSDFSGVDFDRRDVGIISDGTGNHILKTTDKTVTEGFIYARLLKAKLLALSHWASQPEWIEHSVKSPLFGNQYIAWGTFQVPGGYEYGIDFRDTPTGQGVNWGDTLLNMVRNDIRRGNYNRIMNHRMTLKTVGDKHFAGTVITGYAAYHSSGADVHTDQYGELGFPPNSSGVSFVGLPAEGPQSAPILVRVLPADQIHKFIKEGAKLDWESFLPNAA